MASEPAEPTTRPQDELIEKLLAAVIAADTAEYQPEGEDSDENWWRYIITKAVMPTLEAGLLADPAQTTELEELRAKVSTLEAEVVKQRIIAKNATDHWRQSSILASLRAANAQRGLELRKLNDAMARKNRVIAKRRAERDALSLLLRGMARKLVAYRKWMSGDDVPVVHRLRREAEERQDRLDAVTATCEAADAMVRMGMATSTLRWETAKAVLDDVRAALVGDQPPRKPCEYVVSAWAGQEGSECIAMAEPGSDYCKPHGDALNALEPKHKTEGGMCCNGKHGCGGPGSFCCSKSVYLHRHQDGSQGPFSTQGLSGVALRDVEEADDAAGDLP